MHDESHSRAVLLKSCPFLILEQSRQKELTEEETLQLQSAKWVLFRV